MFLLLTLLMKSHFEKYAFLHHFLVFFQLIIATVYAKTYYCCWFEIAVIEKMIYYPCMTSPNDVITIQDVITL